MMALVSLADAKLRFGDAKAAPEKRRSPRRLAGDELKLALSEGGEVDVPGGEDEYLYI
jgi:hypothetical protein